MKFAIQLIFCLSFISTAHATISGDGNEFYAQASQDHFVHIICNEILQKTDQGYYLEIGSADPVLNSNTYFFEKNHHWEGVSIEIDEYYKNGWDDARQNIVLIQDALQIDYHSLLQSFPKIIDYLSLDVDSCYDLVLQLLPFDQHIFNVITIEHDFYRFGDTYRNKEREILTSKGYHLLCADVSHVDVGAFEDWWIHPNAFSEATFEKLSSMQLDGKFHDEIISILENSSNS